MRCASFEGTDHVFCVFTGFTERGSHKETPLREHVERSIRLCIPVWCMSGLPY